MKASIRYISELTGFSPATVSNALNHKKGVNAKTAAEVFRVAKEVGYINENSISKIKLVTFKKNGSIIDDLSRNAANAVMRWCCATWMKGILIMNTR